MALGEETRHQIAVANYLHYLGVLFTATANGVYTSKKQAQIMKAMGLQSGVPDILIFEPRGEYIGLALELKSTKGRPTPAQKMWIEKMKSKGWAAEIGRPETSIDLIDRYLKGELLR